MGVVARIRGERGDNVSFLEDGNVSHLLKVAATLKLANLSLVDPYGHTYFNTLQVPVVQQELAQVEQHGDELAQATARYLLEFSAKIFNDVHLYLVFVGD